MPAFADRCTGGAPEEPCRRVRMAMPDACGGGHVTCERQSDIDRLDGH